MQAIKTSLIKEKVQKVHPIVLIYEVARFYASKTQISSLMKIKNRKEHLIVSLYWNTSEEAE